MPVPGGPGPPGLRGRGPGRARLSVIRRPGQGAAGPRHPGEPALSLLKDRRAPLKDAHQ